MRSRYFRISALLAGVLVATACSDSESGGSGDRGVDSGADLGSDAGSDTTPGDADGADSDTADRTDTAECGNELIEEGEWCDLGDDNGGSDCAWDCTPAAPFLSYDAVITDLMSEYDVPGGAVAVTVGGRLVLVRGYGVMDEDDTAMDPLARFRIASISKPITAAAAMLLVQRGELSLDDLAFDLLDHLLPDEASDAWQNVDQRILDITVNDLLWHTGGWDREDDTNGTAYDPMFIPELVSDYLGIPSPPEPEDIARYMVEQPLEFTPGERYAYSNFGYSLLGQIIEEVTGDDYETFVRREVLEPIGASGMAIGATRLDQVADDETFYFPNGTGTVPSVFDEDGNPNVPVTYGGWYQQSLDAHGGWISSTLDLLRFSNATDGFASVPDLLDAEHQALMTARPTEVWPSAESPSYYYAMGWSVRVVSPTQQNRWHTGALPGTATIMVRTAGEVTWVALYNFRPNDNDWWLDMDQAMWQAAGTVEEWPEYDLFERYE